MARFERRNTSSFGDKRSSGRGRNFSDGDNDSFEGEKKSFRDHVSERRGRFSKSGPKSFSRSRSNDRSRSGDRGIERTRVKCDSCGSMCEVPFKPTGNKPVYCEKCFGGKDNSSSSSRGGELDDINRKLDKIMKALKINK